jgi:hypothetical protein
MSYFWILTEKSAYYVHIDTNLRLVQYMHRKAMLSRDVGEELGYPSVPAALLTGALVLLLSGTLGKFLVRQAAVETFVNQWLPFLQPFVEALPDWARELPFIFGGIALTAILTVRLLAGVLPVLALYLLILGVSCGIALLAPPTRIPTAAEDWIFVCYVILTALVGGAPTPYENQI